MLHEELVPALCRACGAMVRVLPREDACTAGIEACFAYDGPLSIALWRLKYRGDAAVAGPLGAALAIAPIWQRGWDLVVPVPLHWRRRWWRGYDHAALLVRAALRHVQRPPVLARRVLVPTRATPPQTQRSAQARLVNVADAFAVRDPARVRGRRILVVDDVTTTGATLSSCRARLWAAGAAQVGALALMRTLT